MQRRISNEVQHGSTVSLFDMTCQSSPIDRSASNFLNKSGKVGKIESLRNSGEYDANLAKYIPGMLNLVYQGIIENIDTKEQVAHISCKDMETLEFQIMLTNKCYMNPNSIHICFPIKIKKGCKRSN